MPADTFSTDLGFLIMGTGNDNNLWGNNANTAVFQILADAITNVLSEAVTGGTLDLSGSPPPAGPSQVRHWMIKFTGVLASNQIVKVPNIAKGWWINNQTTGAFTLVFETPSGSPSVAIPQGGYTYVWCDGANNINVSPYSSVGVSLQSGQIAGPDGSTGAPTFSWNSELTTGWRRAGTNDVRLVIGGTDVLQVTGAGAGTPNVMNFLPSTGAIQVAGVQVVPPGVTADFCGIIPPTGWILGFGQTLSRTATSTVNLFNAITATTTGNTHANTTIDNLATDLRGLGLEGAFIEGTGISLGTTIVSINSATSMTVSASVAGSNTGITLRILPYGQGDGSTTYNAPDYRGRSAQGRDNMGGTAAGRISVNKGTQLSTNGGEEQHTLLNTELALHNHGITDPGHLHSYLWVNNNGGSPAGSGFQQLAVGPNNNTGTSTTGITINTAGGTTPPGGLAHNNMQPFLMANKIIKL